MRIAVFFHSKTGNTKKAALKIKEFFESKKALVELYSLEPANDLIPKELMKLGKIELKKVPYNVSDYDLVFIGGPVWGFSPSPVVVSFLKTIEKAEGKKFVLFLTCHGFTGTSIKKMSGILATKEAAVIDSFAVKSMFPLSETHLKKVLESCERLYSKAVVL